MGDWKLRVLIVANRGAHQVAIRTLCASLPQIEAIDATSSAAQALAMMRDNPPDLAILGINLPRAGLEQYYDGLKDLALPPFSILLTVSEADGRSFPSTNTGCAIPMDQFPQRLPEVLNRAYDQGEQR